MRQRLDMALVERGLAPTRSQARDLVRRGCVRVAGEVALKASAPIAESVAIDVEAGAQPYVSRGGLKLAAALQAFGFDADGAIALDVGAATGGFTHVLIEAGARRVYAVDVGSGQLHPELAADPRVLSFESCDVRGIDAAMIPEPIAAIVADVSFISLTQALPAAMALAAPGAWLVALSKPQFEAGREHIGKGGIVRDAEARERAVAKVRDWLGAQPSWRVLDVIASPVVGGAGNQEYLIGARRE